jgi:hypothetical protein
MSAEPLFSTQSEEDNPIISPFAQTTSTVRPSAVKARFSWPLWIVSGLLLLVILGNVGYAAYRYLNNPYRTLEPFSADKYLADFQPLTGSKFRAEFTVVADLGWKENVGRLMVFTAKGDARPILVLIPPKLSGIFFSKDQTYEISLKVGEGGLIYADLCVKE